MILLIDNYDSFVHNLARYFERLGQETRVVRNDAVDVVAVRGLRPAAIVLSPGPCTPREAGVSLELVRQLHTEIPMLGVCLGHQVIAETLGGEIVRASEPVHGRTSEIRHDGRGLFANLQSPLTVCRYHSLVVEPTTLPAEIRATAWTVDGTIMALEHTRHPLYGVQFHPESILTEHGYDLLANFLQLAGIEPRGDVTELAQAERQEPRVKHEPLPTGPVTF